MTDMPTYYASELGPDICMTMAQFFFEARRNSRLMITEAAARSGLSVKDVDELETQAGQYDFAKIAKLLDLYGKQLPLAPYNFVDIPQDLSEKYFER